MEHTQYHLRCVICVSVVLAQYSTDAAKVFAVESDVARQLALHWVIPKNSENVGDTQYRLVVRNIPGPVPMLLAISFLE